MSAEKNELSMDAVPRFQAFWGSMFAAQTPWAQMFKVSIIMITNFVLVGFIIVIGMWVCNWVVGNPEPIPNFPAWDNG